MCGSMYQEPRRITKEEAEKRLEERARESREGYSVQTWFKLSLPFGMLQHTRELDLLLEAAERPFHLRPTMYAYSLLGDAVKLYCFYKAAQALMSS
ncbi:hypothetical protein J4219_06175 [Candidatus Woesearchaeota archaeon]|nr:hypothetical protein [Candidatus Woesearchaeota archaeon]